MNMLTNRKFLIGLNVIILVVAAIAIAFIVFPSKKASTAEINGSVTTLKADNLTVQAPGDFNRVIKSGDRYIAVSAPDRLTGGMMGAPIIVASQTNADRITIKFPLESSCYEQTVNEVKTEKSERYATYRLYGCDAADAAFEGSIWHTMSATIRDTTSHIAVYNGSNEDDQEGQKFANDVFDSMSIFVP